MNRSNTVKAGHSRLRRGHLNLSLLPSLGRKGMNLRRRWRVIEKNPANHQPSDPSTGDRTKKDRDLSRPDPRVVCSPVRLIQGRPYAGADCCTSIQPLQTCSAFPRICPRNLTGSLRSGLVRQAGPQKSARERPPVRPRADCGELEQRDAGLEAGLRVPPTGREPRERCLPLCHSLALSATAWHWHDTTTRAAASKSGSTVHQRRCIHGRHEAASSGKCRVRQCLPCQVPTRSRSRSARIMSSDGVTSGCPCSIPLPDLRPAVSRRCL